MLPSEFKAIKDVAERVRAELRQIREAIQHDSGFTQSSLDSLADVRNEIRAVKDVIFTHLSNDDAHSDKSYRQQERLVVAQSKQVKWAFWAFIAALLSVVISGGALWQVKRSVYIGQRANRMTQTLISPVFQLEVPRLHPDRGDVELMLRNVGKTNAINVSIHSVIDEEPLTGGQMTTRSTDNQIPLVPPDQYPDDRISVPMPQHVFPPNFDIGSYFPPEWYDKVIYLRLSVSYDAGLQERQTQTWCRAIIGKRTIPLGAARAVIAPEWPFCGRDAEYWISIRRKDLQTDVKPR